MPTKVVLNRREVSRLLRGEGDYAGVRAELERRAAAIQQRAGASEDYAVDSQVGTKRARTSVRTATPEAMRDEAVHRTLTHAFGAGRGA